MRIAFTLMLWIIFLVTFARAASKGKTALRAGKHIWLMFFLSILSFTFWGEEAEISLDQHFHDMPVALYLKYLCLIGVCHLYLQMLRKVGSHIHIVRWLDHLAPIAIGLGLLSFALYGLFTPIESAELRYIVIAARDLVIFLFIILGFLRGTLSMWKQERKPYDFFQAA